MNLLLEIITPEKVIYKDEVDEVVVPTVNGEIAILPNHISLLTQVNPGEMIVKKGTNQQYLAITGGFLEVQSNKISILAEHAIKAQDIEVARAMEAKKRAEKVMSEKSTDNELRLAQAEMIKAILELKVATRHKRR
ncbi:MAG: ATP synthase epsilon chain [Candidatus Levybacteria bacterium GW2011_GWA2_37_36]|nr:MAG: ATP synthase epsilon chain [Candidatus Levybacteria bacterium GW2011_GWA1_37_16]KKQ33688.1 MAG: ATP synthase epsilon chain [Candidatus Levybacteria bacterium GW2011_GWA2_37_36]KKQ37591.1 MAG: ATP synthase epsilon chain [Candidatus Levybacteria bacterium GW2011_GWC2_37_7]KKQ41504.1 MAG: ATP synthase epsilon chain [Candidatus Levybacteria bacterium GW2011_GWB1_37_8]OGH51021.1 MAG: ATP synthase F1 subunit epsilon [Candidatus Levybacteria bacterium RIFCSPLOWO2_12_FULL_37_14]